MKTAHLLLLVGMNVVWASSFSVYKHLARELTAGTLVTLRYGLAAVLLLIVWPWLPGAKPGWRDAARCLAMGAAVFWAAPNLQVLGVMRGSAADGAVLIALDPLITSVAAAVFLGESVPVRRWLGFGLGFLGVLFISRAWRIEHAFYALTANLMILGSFVLETVYSVVGKPMLARVGLLKVLGLALVGGSLLNLCLAGDSTLAQVEALSAGAWGLLFYLALVLTVLGYALWYVVIREADVSVAGLTLFVQPVTGVLLAVGWLGESLHWGQLWGVVIIGLGLYVGLAAEPQVKRRESAA